MIESDANRHARAAARSGRPTQDFLESDGFTAGRVTKGVATALGRTLAVDRETALPDRLASLVERLQNGPLGQTQLKPRRVA